ncbi:condesin subunit E [Salmonella enterica subsp. enterica]|uniref:Condesin subunit E n=1 Tax=Salmonella enterica I TaxID=59201 RepID=A0A379WCM5_SALET|nr:condesin subunit E [Salmonella enterica subsp. enterica]
MVYGPRQQQIPHYRIGLRFGADVRAGDDPREAQRRLIRDGEAMPIENHLQLNDETEESQPDSGEEE